MLNDTVKSQLKELFNNLEKEVKIVLFSQEVQCQFCKDTEELYREVASLSSKIQLEVNKMEENDKLFEKYNLEQLVPATVLLGEGDKDFGIRIYGIPAGYEFSSFIETLISISTGSIQVNPSTVDYLLKLDKEVELKTFVSNSCPHCPRAALLSNQLAIVSDKVTSIIVEVAEFPFLANKYNVMGVPRTVINEKVYQEGAAPEEMILEKIKSAI